MCFTVGVDGSFQQNDDSVITKLMALKSPQKECYDIAIDDTDLPSPTNIENILLPSCLSENSKYSLKLIFTFLLTKLTIFVSVNTASLLDPVHSLPVDRFCFKAQVLKGPYQPILDIYPSTIQGHKQRSFQKNWYTL